MMVLTAATQDWGVQPGQPVSEIFPLTDASDFPPLTCGNNAVYTGINQQFHVQLLSCLIIYKRATSDNWYNY